MDQAMKRDDYPLRAAWFAVGVVFLAMCWQHACVRSVYEKWRMWVFVALNILVLAILCMSMRSTILSTPSKCSTKEQQARKKNEGLELVKKRRESEGVRKVVVDEGDDLSLSKEDKNERVEAFIAMFKQQLTSDAKTRKQLPNDKLELV